jgi:cytochrome b561
MTAIPDRPASYDRVIRTIHWLTLALIAGIFAAAWAAHSGLAGEWYRPVMQLHRSLGLTVAVLTVFRLAWRGFARIPALPADLHPLQKLAARGMEAAIYLLLVVQPALGLLHTNARNQRVDLFFLGELPAVIAPDKALGRLTHDLHGLVADALLAAIGLHAAAALYHHFIRRDAVLAAMLPGVRRAVRRATRRPARRAGP